jgi:PAS domain S-box-containing protein
MISKIEKLLLGKQRFSSLADQKQALLLGQLSALSALICLIYLIGDPLSGLYSLLLWYFLGVVISIAAVLINRAGYYLMSASLLMLMTVIILFALAYIGDQGRGVYFYFVSGSLVSLVFFYNRSLILGLTFIGLFMLSAALAHYMHIPNQEAGSVSAEAIKLRYMANMLIATVSGVVAILFMVWRNNISESSLLQSNEQLEQMTHDLERSKTRFERALLGTRAGIYEWNILTDSIFISSRWKQLLGYEVNDELPMDLKTFMGFVHPDDAERTSNSINQSVEKDPNYQSEVRLRLKDGNYRWFLDSGVVIREESKPVVAVGSIIDIEDRKRAEDEILNKNEELQKANDELDRFVYSASHDMRAPLSTLLGLIEVVKLTDDPGEYGRYFEMMISRIHDMEGFISEVTDYSRNTRLAVNKRPVNLYSLVSSLKDSFSTLANQGEVAINIEIDEELVITTDETRLKVILNNLMANAIKYNNADKNRYVKVSASSDKKYCTIQVKDNGRGIAKEFQARIFDMFFRASDDSTGSGLGLYIVKETLDKLGGDISFNSELRAGTTFTVRIPKDS